MYLFMLFSYICEIYMKEYRGNLFKSYYIFYHQNENSSKNCSKSADPESASNSIPAANIQFFKSADDSSQTKKNKQHRYFI